MKRTNSRILRNLGLSLSFLTLPLTADVWVDRHAVGSAQDGTQANPYLTIQAGVDAASPGETVWVEPGLYTETTVGPDGHASVVVISKDVTVASTKGRYRTVIRGHKGAASSGLGADAARCVYIGSNAKAVVKGFTLRNGYSGTGTQDGFTSDDLDSNRGGGVLMTSKSANAQSAAVGANAYVVDCIIADCKAQRGGGGHGGNFVRCLVTGCSATNSGSGERNVNTYNCVFYNNSSASLFHGTHVNTTVLVSGRGQQALLGSPACYNCLLMGDAEGVVHSEVNSSAKQKFYNCVLFKNSDGKGADLTENESVTWSNSRVAGDAVAAQIATLDFRPVSATLAGEAVGSAAYFSKIPEAYRDVDFMGNALPSTDACHVGACQGSFAVEPKGTPVPFTRTGPDEGTFFVDGAPVWFSGTVRVTGPSATITGQGVGTRVFTALRYYKSGSVFLPDMAENKIQLIPAAGATAQDDSLVAEFYDPIWADAVTGDDTTADGSSVLPFKTLQAAHDKAKTGSSTRLVLARPGDYNDGGKSGCDLMTRLVLTDKVYIRSTGGADTTFISGEGDPDSATGLGPKAVRCVAIPNAVGGSVQGFTLRGGRTDVSAGGGKADRGGALCCGFGSIYLSTANGGSLCPTLADCVITGCDGKSGLVYYGSLKRCRVTRNTSSQAVSIGAWQFATIFDQNTVKANSVFGMNSRVVNCTIANNKGLSAIANYNGSFLHNCIVYNNNVQAMTSNATAENVLYEDGYTGENCVNCRQGLPSFVSIDRGDFRLMETSPAFGLGSTNYVFSGALNSDKNPKDTWAYCDFVGQDGALLLAADGAVTVGACGSKTPRVYHEIFVAADGVDETADGTVEKPFGTIQAAVEAAKGAEETSGLPERIVVKPGIYAAGRSWLSSADPETALPARVTCEKNIEIVSAEGAEKTVIEGLASTDPTAKRGCGPGAIRCVYMAHGTLKGFTLRASYTHLAGNTPTANDEGGAIRAGDDAWIVDCVVSNCFAGRAGAGYGGNYRNCRFVQCGAVNTASYFRYPKVLHQCFFGKPVNASPMVVGCPEIKSCTFACGVGQTTEVLNNCTYVANTMICSGAVNVNYDTFWLNCAYNPETTSFVLTDGKTFTTNACVSGQLELDADGVPVKGANVGMDAGNVSLLPLELGTDLAGVQRVYNGALDIGCREYDYRADYARVLGDARTIAVTSASPNVTLRADGEAVLLPDGASLDIALRNPRTGVICTLPVDVSGGTLSFAQNGGDAVSVTETPFAFRNLTLLDNLAFAFAASEEGGRAELGALVRALGFHILIR